MSYTEERTRILEVAVECMEIVDHSSFYEEDKRKLKAIIANDAIARRLELKREKEGIS
jgi:hypothetical protein